MGSLRGFFDVIDNNGIISDMTQWRNISLDHVRQAIREPDKEEEAYNNAIRVKKDVGDKIIEVIYCKEAFRDKKNEVLVVTAYYL